MLNTLWTKHHSFVIICLNGASESNGQRYRTGTAHSFMKQPHSLSTSFSNHSSLKLSHTLSLSLSLSLSNHEPLSFHQTLSLFPIKCLSLITPHHHHHHQLPSLLCFTHSQTTASSSNPTCPYSPSCAVHFSVHPTRRLRRRSTYHLARRRSSRSRTRRRLRTRLRLRLPHAAKPHPTGVFFSLFLPLLCLVPNLVNYLVKEHKIFLCVFLRCNCVNKQVYSELL